MAIADCSKTGFVLDSKDSVRSSRVAKLNHLSVSIQLRIRRNKVANATESPVKCCLTRLRYSTASGASRKRACRAEPQVIRHKDSPNMDLRYEDIVRLEGEGGMGWNRRLRVFECMPITEVLV